MAYSAPSTRSTGELCTAAIWNADVVANAIAINAGALSVTSQAIGDILYASSTTQFARIAAVATGQVLTSAGTGTVPAWSSNVDLGGTLDVTGRLLVDSAGPSALGQAVSGTTGLVLGGAFTSDGSSNYAYKVNIAGALTGASGDTARLALFRVGGTGITTHATSETTTLVTSAYIAEPSLTKGSGSTVTNATALYIDAAPSGATNNYAIWVDAGASRFDGNVGIGGASTGARLEVEDGGISHPGPLFISRQDTDDVWNMVLCNDAYSTTALYGCRMTVGTGGDFALYAPDKGSSPGDIKFFTDETERLEIASDGGVTAAGALIVGGATNLGHTAANEAMVHSQITGTAGGYASFTNITDWGTNRWHVDVVGVAHTVTALTWKGYTAGYEGSAGGGAIVFGRDVGASWSTYCNIMTNNTASAGEGALQGNKGFMVAPSGMVQVSGGTDTATAMIMMNPGNQSVADDAVLTITGIPNVAALISVTYSKAGQYRGGLFHVEYHHTDVTKLADADSMFANSDTDGKMCCYKTGWGSSNFYVKNRTGGTALVSISVIRFQGL